MASPRTPSGKPDAGPDAQPVSVLPGVGPALADKLSRLGVSTVQDLLFLLPLRYEDRTRVVPIGGLRAGERAVVEGEIELAQTVYRRRRSLLVRIADGTGALTLRFFHFSAAQAAGLARGRQLRCFGEVRSGPAGLEIIHPEYRLLRDDDCGELEQSLTPIYPATEGLAQGRLRALSESALGRIDRVRELLPEPVLARLALPTLAEALRTLHRPPPDVDLAALASGRHAAQRRLAFEELLAHQLSLRVLRETVRRDAAHAFAGAVELVERFVTGLPFVLTGAQSRVAAEIAADMAQPQPMLRLVQGDVGSGKTVVAATAVLRAVAGRCQAAVMAPTELLAEQHMRNFSAWLEPLGIEVGFLAGKVKGKARSGLLGAIAAGRIGVVIGTHALFQEGVAFDRLALVVIDEQHRFGVHQRLALHEKGRSEGLHPHQLVMTATPIPRTLAQTAYADLDVSIIDELPPGRSPVKTVAIPASRRAEIVQRIDAACAAGQQVYWVCPLIEASEEIEAEAAGATAAQLTEALAARRVGLIHGRMKPKEKDAAMSRFRDGAIDVLVATTVIEVGVDVPNASLMIIENAERMGLAQLHQLRGRVGRGARASSCLLLYRPGLSELARERLAVLRSSNDGFEVARRDLELRGPGELLGTKQTGLMQMRVADLLRDADLLPEVQRAAAGLLAEQRERVGALIRRWVGTDGRYGTV